MLYLNGNIGQDKKQNKIREDSVRNNKRSRMGDNSKNQEKKVEILIVKLK